MLDVPPTLPDRRIKKKLAGTIENFDVKYILFFFFFLLYFSIFLSLENDEKEKDRFRNGILKYFDRDRISSCFDSI